MDIKDFSSTDEYADMVDKRLKEAKVSEVCSNDGLCTIEHTLLKRVYFSLETARDNAAECYNSHMQGLGMTTEKNKHRAKLYKDDLDEVEALISLLSAQWKFGA